MFSIRSITTPPRSLANLNHYERAYYTGAVAKKQAPYSLIVYSGLFPVPAHADRGGHETWEDRHLALPNRRPGVFGTPGLPNNVKTRSQLRRANARLRCVARFAGNGGGGGNRTRVRRPSAPSDYVRSPVSDSPPPLPGAGASVASLSASRRASLKRGGPASLYHGAFSVGQAAYSEKTRSLSCECQFLVGSCYVPSCFTRPLGPRHATRNIPISVDPIRPPYRLDRNRPICCVVGCAPVLTYLSVRSGTGVARALHLDLFRSKRASFANPCVAPGFPAGSRASLRVS